MFNFYYGLIIFILGFNQTAFAGLHHGAGLQLTSEGAGVYYKMGWDLQPYYQFIGDIGLHFDQSMSVVNTTNYYPNIQNSYQSNFLDLSAGFRRELLTGRIAGSFRPIILVQGGGVAGNNSFSKDKLQGVWNFKYSLGTGIQFKNRKILNEIIFKYFQSTVIQGNIGLQLAIYWK